MESITLQFSYQLLTTDAVFSVLDVLTLDVTFELLRRPFEIFWETVMEFDGHDDSTACVNVTSGPDKAMSSPEKC